MDHKKFKYSERGLLFILLLVSGAPVCVLVLVLVALKRFNHTLYDSLVTDYLLVTLLVLILLLIMVFLVALWVFNRLRKPIHRLLSKTRGIRGKLQNDSQGQGSINTTGFFSQAFSDVEESIRSAEASLRQSEEYLNLFSEHSRLGILVVIEGKIQHFNKTAAVLLGLEAMDLAGKSIDLIRDNIDISDHDYVFTKTKTEENIKFRENSWFRVNKPEGGYRWLEMFSREVVYHGENATVLTLIDNTEVKSFEGKLKEQNQFLQSIMDAVADPMFVIEAETKALLMANEAAKRKMQDPDLPTCFQLENGCLQCRELKHICPFEMAKLTRISSTAEHEYQDKNGKKRYYEIHGHPILDENNDVVQVIEYHFDITARKMTENSLRESEERYSSLFENNHTVMLLLHPDSLDILDANPAACRFYGHDINQLITKSFDELSTDSLTDIKEKLKPLAEQKQITVEMVHKRSNGTVKDVEVFFGEIIISAQPHLFAMIYDISERVRAEYEIKRRQEYDALATNLATRFINLSSEEIDSEIVMAMMEISEFMGVDRSFVFLADENNHLSVTHQWRAPGIKRLRNRHETYNLNDFPWLRSSLNSLHPLRISSMSELPEKAVPDQSFLNILGKESILLVPLYTTRKTSGFFGISNDRFPITWTDNHQMLVKATGEMLSNTLDRKQFEEKLKESRNRIKDLSAHIQDRVENERASIAREVHDELGQLLTALKFDISWLSGKIPDDDPRIYEKGESMKDLIDVAIKSVQRIISELRPVMLDELGLAPAIEWLVRDFCDRTGIESELKLSDIQAEGPMAISLYRITQEALTNIGRHSFATRLELYLSSTEEEVNLRIKDNGVGITADQLKANNSYGLMGLQERASFLGGKVTIDGKKGEGTAIDVIIPYPKKVNDDKNSRS